LPARHVRVPGQLRWRDAARLPGPPGRSRAGPVLRAVRRLRGRLRQHRREDAAGPQHLYDLRAAGPGPGPGHRGRPLAAPAGRAVRYGELTPGPYLTWRPQARWRADGSWIRASRDRSRNSAYVSGARSDSARPE